MKVISKSNFSKFVDDLIEKDEREVVGAQAKSNEFAFNPLESADDLRLDYDVTILPPKKYFMPQRETLVEYNLDEGETTPVNQVVPRIIMGIHPYDLVAIEQMDKVFEDTHEDPYYLEKRRQSVLVGVNMVNVSDWSFAHTMGTATTDSGYDLMLTDIGDRYAIEVGSSKGSNLLEKAGGAVNDIKSEGIKKVKEYKEELPKKFRNDPEFDPFELPSLLKKFYGKDEFWEENAEDCLSCGTCNLVCPTCYCFDVQDVNDISLSEGERLRTWDGCMLEAFAEVAGDENFREEKAARYRHRYMRKGRYMYNRYGDIACVGCGRCSEQCLPDIADPVDVFNQMKEESS
ncbi:MAG: 4Fe-4S dicluster domain-containing protein [Candidatus Acetothermia bacterium]